MPHPLKIMDIGRSGYEDALDLQFELLEQRQNEKIGDTLVLVEHPPVITLGRSGKDSDILASEEELRAAGAKVFRINRGGEVTYHGPGQIVGYMIINLYNHQRKLKQFVWNLEEVFFQLLATEYGIQAQRDQEHRGVWVRDEKITAIGIAIKNGVTMHGFAFNVSVDLSHFQWIVPCGIRDRGQTSLEALTGKRLSLSEVKRQVVRHFCATLDYELPEPWQEPR